MLIARESNGKLRLESYSNWFSNDDFLQIEIIIGLLKVQSCHLWCPECGIELNQWTLKQHLVAKHGNEEFKSVTCDYCGKGFASKHGLRDHRMIHEDARPFPCRFENCDFSSKTSGNRKKHEIGKHGAGKRTLKKTVS